VVHEDHVAAVAAWFAVHADALRDAGKRNAAIEPERLDRDVALEGRFRCRYRVGCG
jgi:hypothetical protein